jgi:hypothetical protein
MTKRFRAGLAGLSALACAGAVLAGAEDRTPTPTVRLGLEGVTNGHVAVAADARRVVVTWAARTPAATDVYAAFSKDGGASFGAPVRVNDVPGDARASGEQAPRVALGSGVEVVWNARADGASVVRAATTRPGADTFSPATTVHPGGLKGARGWASLALAPSGSAHVAWLDGRVNAAPPSAAAPASSRHAMRQDLFQAVRRADGTSDEVRVASDVCFCCKTAIAAGPDGAIYVAWRHIFPPNLRDMAVARSTDGGRTFGPPVRLSQDGWAIDACPDDGPSIAVDARNVLHVAWPTQVSPTAGKGIFYTTSGDGGRSFAPRTRVDDASGGPAHPQLALSGDHVVVAWDESGGTGPRRVRMRAVAPSMLPITNVSAGASAATYPAIVATADATLVAWTEETATGSDVRLQRFAR